MALPFVKAPSAVIKDRDISAMARFLYVILSGYADLKTRRAVVFRSTLALDLGKSVDTVDRLLRELVEAGLVVIERVHKGAGGFSASHYLLRTPTAPKPSAATPDGGEAPAPDVVDGAEPAREVETSSSPFEVAAPVRLPVSPNDVEDPDTDGLGGRTHAARVAAPVRRGGRTGAARKENHLSRARRTTTEAAAADPDGAPADDTLFEVDPPPPDPGKTVQLLVGAYVDAVRSVRGVATKSMCGAIGKHCKRLMRDDDLPPAVLLVAVQRAGKARAKDVDRFLGDTQQTYNRDSDRRREMFATWERLAREVDTANLQIGA